KENTGTNAPTAGAREHDARAGTRPSGCRRVGRFGRAVPLGQTLDFSPQGEGAECVPSSVTNLPGERFARIARLLCGGKRLTHCSLPYQRTGMSSVGSPHLCGCPRKLSTSSYGGCGADLAPGMLFFLGRRAGRPWSLVSAAPSPE